MHHNLQCAKNKIEEVELLLWQENIDILCVSETWIQPMELNYINLRNYNISSSFCRKTFLHGGTMILTRNTLDCTENTRLVNLSVDKIFECSAIDLKINDVEYCIICLYRAPNSDVNAFLSKLEECLNLLTNKCNLSHIILCGDFNINFLCKDKNTTDLIDLVSSYYISTVFDEPTRIQNNTKSAIDYIMTNFPNKILSKFILDTGISDHCGQKIVIDVQIPQKEQPYKFRSFSNNNISNFTEALNAESWQNVYDEVNVDAKYLAFNKIISYLYNSSFKFVYKKSIRNDNNWITTGIKISSSKLKELFSLQKNGMLDREYYKTYKKVYKKVIRRAKQMYFDELIINSANKSKTVWRIINNSLKNNASTNKFEIEVNGHITSENSIISNEFNSYFVNLPKLIRTSLKQHNSISKTSPITMNDSIYLNPVTTTEIINVIQNLKQSNSVGPDDISIKIIKKCAHQLAEPLCHIINTCFQDGMYPNMLKLSKILPLYKKGDHKLLSNYRPIAILSVFSKIFEKILATRIITFLESKQLLSPNQHGFREHKSTTTALLAILNHVYKNLDQNKKVLATFVDLSKAFDCVDHQILLKTIESYGIRGLCNDLLRSYLDGRKQFVQCFEERSDELLVDSGVPQGSVLGPLLFILYINDLDNSISSYYGSFADDITIILSGDNSEIVLEQLKNTIKSVADYFNSKKLIFNQDKTFLMQFYPIGSRYNSSLLLQYNGKSVQQLTSFKLLGIHIDMSLDWKSHVTAVCSKCASKCFALKRLRQITSINTIKTYYFANMESHIRYGILFWGNSTTANRVFLLQKRAIRNMFGLGYRESCKSTFIKQKILTLPSLYIFEIIKFVKENLSDFNFQNAYHHYPTRHGHDLQYEIHRLKLYESNPYYIGTILYNKLSNDIKSIASPKKFYSTIKSLLVANAFYSVNDFLQS